jgi:hypothetical protein
MGRLGTAFVGELAALGKRCRLVGLGAWHMAFAHEIYFVWVVGLSWSSSERLICLLYSELLASAILALQPLYPCRYRMIRSLSSWPYLHDRRAGESPAHRSATPLLNQHMLLEERHGRGPGRGTEQGAMWEAQLDPGRSQLSGEIHVLCQVHRSWFMHNTARRYQSNDAPRYVPISLTYRGIAYPSSGIDIGVTGILMKLAHLKQEKG